MKTPLQTVREKVIEAVPDLVNKYADSLWVSVRNGAGKDAYSEVEDYINENPEIVPIHLADVLRATIVMKSEKRGTGKYTPSYLTILPELITSWNLTKDDLSLQSEQTINFLAELLTK